MEPDWFPLEDLDIRSLRFTANKVVYTEKLRPTALAKKFLDDAIDLNLMHKGGPPFDIGYFQGNGAYRLKPGFGRQLPLAYMRECCFLCTFMCEEIDFENIEIRSGLNTLDLQRNGFASVLKKSADLHRGVNAYIVEFDIEKHWHAIDDVSDKELRFIEFTLWIGHLYLSVKNSCRLLEALATLAQTDQPRYHIDVGYATDSRVRISHYRTDKDVERVKFMEHANEYLAQLSDLLGTCPMNHDGRLMEIIESCSLLDKELLTIFEDGIPKPSPRAATGVNPYLVDLANFDRTDLTRELYRVLTGE